MSDLSRPQRELTTVLEPKDIPPVFTLRAHHVKWHWDALYFGPCKRILPTHEQEKGNTMGFPQCAGCHIYVYFFFFLHFVHALMTNCHLRNGKVEIFLLKYVIQYCMYYNKDSLASSLSKSERISTTLV